MWSLLKKKIDLSFIVNPFYIYCIAFSLAIFTYLWGWSEIFPELSATLIIFFIVSFIIFMFAGYFLGKNEFLLLGRQGSIKYLNDIIFWLIILLGFLNVILVGYLPILDRSKNYHEFGAPVIDPLFNTLSIFFSVFFFQSYLEKKKKRLLIYVFVILLIQILLFRRSTLIWIITSCSFLFLIYKRKIHILIIIATIICIPLFSYCFGLYQNLRSNLTRAYVVNDLGASDSFKNSGIPCNHYLTYLYISSPLANLQKNVNQSDGFINKGNFRGFFFYCLMPVSFTIRLETPMNLKPPDCELIAPDLNAGSFFMESYYTMGWAGMIVMLLFLFIFIFLCLFIIRKWDTFSVTTFSILSTTVSLLIFSNFLNHLDVILMLFFYPVLFHFIFSRSYRVLN